MSDRPVRVEVNCVTGEQKTIELTDEEIAADEAARAEAEAQAEAQRLEAEAIDAIRASARAKLIAGEPLTEEEASLLL